MQTMLKNVNVISVMGAYAAGDTSENGTGVDMSGYDGVMFIASIGALTAGQQTALKAQGAPDNATWADFATEAVTPNMADADSNKLLVLDIFRPQTRYVRPVLERGTQNAVINSIVAVLYNAEHMPTTPDTSISQEAYFESP